MKKHSFCQESKEFFWQRDIILNLQNCKRRYFMKKRMKSLILTIVNADSAEKSV